MKHDFQLSALDGICRLIGQYPRQATILHGILGRGVRTVGDQPWRRRDAKLLTLTILSAGSDTTVITMATLTRSKLQRNPPAPEGRGGFVVRGPGKWHT